jgi:hypothetical protein
VFIASLSIQIRRAGVQKKFGGQRSHLELPVAAVDIAGIRTLVSVPMLKES